MESTTPNTVSERYAEAQTPLTVLLDAVPAEAWTRPSPCEEWAARDVVRHLIETQRDFLAGRGFEVGPDVDVDADPAAAWRVHSSEVNRLLARPEVATTGYDGYFGPTTVGKTLVQFYVPDMVVHRWDIASAVGGDTGWSDAELERTAASIESWGEAMYSDGICKARLEPPIGASPQVVLLARMGRRAW